jgi:hypothetical protein
MRIEFVAFETQPPGDWDVFADVVSIAGEEHRLSDCRDFLEGVSGARKAGLPFGIRMEREPANLHDKCAIRVVAFWRENGWFSPKEHERHVGYIPAPAGVYRSARQHLVPATQCPSTAVARLAPVRSSMTPQRSALPH